MTNIRRAFAQILLGIAAQVLAMSSWFATAAAVPSLTAEFDIDGAQGMLLIAAVQAGFAVGAFVVGLARVADRLRPGILVPLGAIATGLATVMPLLDDTSFALLVASRCAVGVCLATVYPSGMRATVSWATPRWRGLAVSGVVGALTVGTAVPYLLESTPVADWRAALVICAAAAAIAALLGLFLTEGPFVQTARVPASAPVVVLKSPLRNRGQQRITAGYVGHMWEVYGLWVWLPALLTTLPALAGAGTGVLSFTIVGFVGAAGCLIGGLLASRYGKRLVARGSVAISALGGVPWGGVVSRLGCHVVDVVSHRAMVSENCVGISRKDTHARWLLTSLPSSSYSGN